MVSLLKLYCTPIGKAFNMLKLADYSEKEEIVYYVANSWSACWLSGYGAVMLAEWRGYESQVSNLLLLFQHNYSFCESVRVSRIRVKHYGYCYGLGSVFTSKKLRLFFRKIFTENSKFHKSVFHEPSPKVTPCKIRLRPGLRRDPTRGDYRAPPRPPS